MKVKRPSRFVVVSLLVLLVLGFGINLYIAHRAPSFKFIDGTTTTIDEPQPSDLLGWPTVPEGVISPELGSPFQCARFQFSTHWSDHVLWMYELDSAPGKYGVINLSRLRFGMPLTVRSEKEVFRQVPKKPHFYLWPIRGTQSHPFVTYHPLGLILNPIMYALPPWLLLMGARWALATRRRRKRKQLGLCVGCAYELAGLSVCPECGKTCERAQPV